MYDFRLEKIVSPLMEGGYYEVLSKPKNSKSLGVSIDQFFLNISGGEALAHIHETFDFIDGFEGIKVSINVNAAMLKNDAVVDCIILKSKMLKSKNIKICLEFNEYCFSALDEDRLNVLFYKFSNANIDIWLDDFGIGSSNISSIIANRFDVIKIDKKIFWLFFETYKSLLVELISFIKNNGCMVVIEGIETKEQLEFSLENDCYSQGYIFNDKKSVLNSKKENNTFNSPEKMFVA